MADVNDIKIKLEQRDETLEPVRRFTPATLLAIDYPDSANVKDKPGYVWASELASPGSTFMVRNNSVPPVPQSIILLGFLTKDINEERSVIGPYNNTTNYPGYDPDTEGGLNSPKHAPAHAQISPTNIGVDPLDIWPLALAEGRILPNTGLIVEARPITYSYNRRKRTFVGGFVDLTNSVPTDTGVKVIVLLYLDKALNRVFTEEGNFAATPTYPTFLPDTIPLAYVHLSSGQTSIVATDIEDSRFWLNDGVPIATFKQLEDTPEYYGFARQMIKVSDTEDGLVYADEPVTWRGSWVADDFLTNDMVRDGNWTMIANKDTSDRPAPQPEGDPYWILPEAPTWDVQTPTVEEVVSGHRFTWARGGYLHTLRIWIENPYPDYWYQVVIYNTGQSTPIFTGEIREGTTLVAGWNEFEIGTKIVFEGTQWDILLKSHNAVSAAVTVAPYNFTSSNQDYDVASGEAHQRNNRDTLRFHKTDSDGTDQSAMLAALGPGSTVEANGRIWNVDTITDGGPWIEIGYTASGGIPVDGLYDFTFTNPGPQPTEYVRIVDHFLGNPNVRGLFGVDGATPAEDDNAYGVDIQVQEASVSPDWDYVAFSGAGTSGGGGGGVDTFDALLDTPPSKVGHALKSLQVNVAETAIEYVDYPHSEYLLLNDTPPPGSYTGNAGYSPIVNLAETGLEFEEFVPKSGGTFTGQVNVLDIVGVRDLIAVSTASGSERLDYGVAGGGAAAFVKSFEDAGTPWANKIEFSGADIIFKSTTGSVETAPEVFRVTPTSFIVNTTNVGFYGTPPISQPDGVDAAQAIMDLGLGVNITGGGGGAATFDDLTDTPSGKVGFAGYAPTVNGGETALEYIEYVPRTGGDFTGSVNVVSDTNSPFRAKLRTAWGLAYSAQYIFGLEMTDRGGLTGDTLEFLLSLPSSTGDSGLAGGFRVSAQADFAEEFTFELFPADGQPLVTLSNDKLGFYGIDPVPQPDSVDAAQALMDLGLGVNITGGGGGATTYDDLTDTTASKAGAQYAVPYVNAIETTLDYSTILFNVVNRVGIGTIAPETILHVKGLASHEIIRLESVTNTSPYISFYDNAGNRNGYLQASGSNNDMRIVADYLDDISLITGGIQRLLVHASGSVSIGENKDGGNVPLVVTPLGSNQLAIQIRAGNSGTNPYLGFYNNDSTERFAYIQANNSGGYLIINADTALGTYVLINRSIGVDWPTGGNKGPGTINVKTGIYRNGSAYNHPGFVFEQEYTGAIVRFATDLSKRWDVLPTIDQIDNEFRIGHRILLRPESDNQVVDIFEHAEILEANIEAIYLYIIQLHNRIKELEN